MYVFNPDKADDNNSEGWVISSESCCFQSIGAIYYREVLPGELLLHLACL